MAKSQTSGKRSEERSYDVGTLWTMTRHGCVARCALLSLRDEWELSVLVDGQPLLSTRCVAAKDVFAVAEEWKERMTGAGWAKVTPPFPVRARVA